MLCNLENILKKAMIGNYAVAQFNINNLEWTKYILEECEINKSPVILGVSEGTIKHIGGYNTVFSLVKNLMQDLNITIPVVLHLDHGSTIESCKNAINAGFTSVMIDASKYDIEKNIEIVKKVNDYAKKFNVSVEAEIGSIGGQEDNLTSEIYYAKVEDCTRMYNCTKVSALAPAVGSIHGLYKEEPNLNFNRIKEISNAIKIPLVLHGGTGLRDTDIKEAIKCGISKININTELQVRWAIDVRNYLENNKNIYDPRKIISSGEQNLKKCISNKLHLLGSCNKI